MIEEYKTKQPSVLSDPFKKDKVTKVYVSSKKSDWDDEVYHYGVIEFQNGSTKGRQEFEGSSFDDVVLQIKAFIDTL